MQLNAAQCSSMQLNAAQAAMSAELLATTSFDVPLSSMDPPADISYQAAGC
jgi:hypothetical protein